MTFFWLIPIFLCRMIFYLASSHIIRFRYLILPIYRCSLFIFSQLPPKLLKSFLNTGFKPKPCLLRDRVKYGYLRNNEQSVNTINFLNLTLLIGSRVKQELFSIKAFLVRLLLIGFHS